MATETSKNIQSTMTFKPTENELLNFENALKHPEFRSLLCEYAKDVKNPLNQSLFEAEIAQFEKDNHGIQCQFLHPQPGYVLKTTNLRNDEKVFINICFEPTVPAPLAEDGLPLGSSFVSLPFFQSQPRRDYDRGGRTCMVYDVMFNPLCWRPDLKTLVTQSALDAIENAFQDKLDRVGVKHPKLKFKGTFKPTVIRNKLEDTFFEAPPFLPGSDEDLGVEGDRLPEYSVKYRQIVNGIPINGMGLGRPDQLVIEILLPEMENANGVDLDITEKGLTMSSTEPAIYSLNLKFSYPVLEEEATAKFDKTIHTLSVVAPIKPAENEVKRLVSTDSGIDVDTGYCDDMSQEQTTQPGGKQVDQPMSLDLAKTLLPPYSCNIYEEVMIFTLDVNNVSESSLVKSAMASEEFGFSLKFSSMGAGMVPFYYEFHCALEMENNNNSDDVFSKFEKHLKNMDVEVWDNNVIVKLVIPEGTECLKYKVGSNPNELTLHSLPQLKALRKKREDLKKNDKRDQVEPTSVKTELNNEPESDKGRHSSGESEDSLFSPPVDKEDKEEEEEVESRQQIRSILKSKKQRCFSESWKSGLSQDGDIIESREEEVDEAFASSEDSSCSSKKSVRFSEVVQKHVFRPTSSILGQTSKNLKKKLAKQRKSERRASESDVSVASSVEKDHRNDDNNNNTNKKVGAEDEVNNDSGVASSVDEGGDFHHNGIKNNTTNKNKRNNRSKRNNNKSQRKFLSSETLNDLIFDLDDI